MKFSREQVMYGLVGDDGFIHPALYMTCGMARDHNFAKDYFKVKKLIVRVAK
jgi:hypothetical protein